MDVDTFWPPTPQKGEMTFTQHENAEYLGFLFSQNGAGKTKQKNKQQMETQGQLMVSGPIVDSDDSHSQDKTWSGFFTIKAVSIKELLTEKQTKNLDISASWSTLAI